MKYKSKMTKNIDNDKVTNHTGLSWAGLSDNVDGLKLEIEEVLNEVVYWKPVDNRLKNIPNIRNEETYFYVLIKFYTD